MREIVGYAYAVRTSSVPQVEFPWFLWRNGECEYVLQLDGRRVKKGGVTVLESGTNAHFYERGVFQAGIDRGDYRLFAAPFSFRIGHVAYYAPGVASPPEYISAKEANRRTAAFARTLERRGITCMKNGDASGAIDAFLGVIDCGRSVQIARCQRLLKKLGYNEED